MMTGHPRRPLSSSIRLVLAVGLTLALAPSGRAQDARVQQDRLDAAAFDASALDRVEWNDDRAVPQFLAGDLGPVEDAPAFYRANAALFGFSEDPEIRVTGTQTDDLGLTHVRVQQTIGGVPVWGATSALHLDRDGNAYAWGGDLFPEADRRYSAPALDEDGALAAALLDLGPVQLRPDVPADALGQPIDWSPTAELVVLPHDGAFRQAYHVRVFTDAPITANWEVFVDAATGEVLQRFNSIHTTDPRLEAVETESTAAEWPGPPYARTVMDGPTNGSGTSLFGGTLSLPTYLYQGAYYLYDTTRGPSYIRTMTANGGSSAPGSYVTDADNSFTATNQRAAVDAHYGAVTTFDYFKNTHGRSSYDGANANVTSTISYQFWTGSGYSPNNAAWNGAQLLYGDGDGSTFTALVALDIAAHEFTHAVTDNSADLIYNRESGALNEAVSDIFAIMVDRDDWKVGENSYTPGTSGDALRYMDDPTLGGQPAHYDDRLYAGSCTPSSSNDNCGVHSNSGIANKQAYLMVAGGTFRGVSVTGVGRSATERIWYRALTTYFTSSTNFAGARQGTLQAAADLYGSGSAQYAAVEDAWAAVGVGSTSGGGGGTGSGTPEWRYEDVLAETPHNYPNNYTFTHTYTKPGAQRVAMYFERFELETNYDFVTIKDENGATQATYTGTKAAFWAIVDGAEISSTIDTDYSVRRYGYRITRAAYYANQALLVGGSGAELDGEPLGFVPEAAASDVIAPGAALSKAEVAELALSVGPNPVTSRATALLDLPEAHDVRVAVVDLLGREVAVAFEGTLEAGRQPVSLATDALPAGVYVVVLDVAGQRLTQRVTVVR